MHHCCCQHASTHTHTLRTTRQSKYQEIEAKLRKLDGLVGQGLLQGDGALLGQPVNVHEDGCHQVKVQARDDCVARGDVFWDGQDPVILGWAINIAVRGGEVLDQARVVLGVGCHERKPPRAVWQKFLTLEAQLAVHAC